MLLDANDPELKDYVFTYSKKGEDKQPHFYHDEAFYVCLLELQINIINYTQLVMLYKIFVAGYDEGYHDGY